MANASSIYGIKEVDFRWIRYYKYTDTNGTMEKYKVYAKGKAMFFLNPKCCKCLNLQWIFDPSKDKVTDTQNHLASHSKKKLFMLMVSVSHAYIKTKMNNYVITVSVNTIKIFC